MQILARWFLRLLRATDDIPEERRQQIETLVHIIRWGIGVLILGTALLMLLGTFGVPITPLLTGAGVAGLAVSLGAQTLIQDLIGGFLILLENQYAVGDVIQVADVSGAVEQLTLRATYIRDIDGRLLGRRGVERRLLDRRVHARRRCQAERLAASHNLFVRAGRSLSYVRPCQPQGVPL